jgi:hypothetical protein
MNPFGTPGRRPRSIAYLTSADTTGLLQPAPPPSGGLYLMPGLILNVIVLPLLVSVGADAASSGTGAPVSAGGQPISGVSTA